MKTSLHHPALVVPDLGAAIAFYGQMFGFEEVFRGEWQDPAPVFNQIVGLDHSAGMSCVMRGGTCYLELFEYTAPSAPVVERPQAHHTGLRHLAFEVEDVDAALAQCCALGGSRINDPADMPGGARAVYARDPFGNLIEFLSTGGRMPSLKTL